MIFFLKMAFPVVHFFYGFVEFNERVDSSDDFFHGGLSGPASIR